MTSGLVFAIGFSSTLVFVACIASVLLLARRSGGMRGIYMPWRSNAEMNRLRKLLEGTEDGRRIKLLERVAIIAWVLASAVTLGWKLFA